ETKKYEKNWLNLDTQRAIVANNDISSDAREYQYAIYKEYGARLAMNLVGVLVQAAALRDIPAANVKGISYFPFISKRSETTLYPEGQIRDVIVTKQEYDSFGNVLRIVKEDFDGKTISTTSTYFIDLQKWIVGALQAAEATTTDRGESVTRRMRY